MKRNLPMALFAWCFVVLVAAFLPWATRGFVEVPVAGESLTQTSTGLSGYILLKSLLIPNWLPAVIACVLAVIGWLYSQSIFVRPTLSYILSLYGAFHAGTFILNVLSETGIDIRPGIGSLGTFIAFVLILFHIPGSKVEAEPVLDGFQDFPKLFEP